MDEFSTTSDTLEEADEVILTPTASDDALLEAAGGFAAAQTIHGLLCSTRTLAFTAVCESCD
jgi:hypothetical protein